jgi:hypothetical protein
MRALAALLLSALLIDCNRDLPITPPDLAQADAQVHPDFRTWRWCVQAIGDGGGDQLAPGVACGPGSQLCAPPVQCTFDAFDLSAACVMGTCCQYAKAREMTGTVSQCSDCGSGWSC